MFVSDLINVLVQFDSDARVVLMTGTQRDVEKSIQGVCERLDAENMGARAAEEDLPTNDVIIYAGEVLRVSRTKSAPA